MNTQTDKEKIDKEYAKSARKNGTKSERMVWKYILKYNKFHWVKQKILFEYRVDFYCNALKMIIEVDGETHDNNHSVKYDKNRLETFKTNGFYVLILRNEEVQTIIYTVKEYVERIIEERHKELGVK